MARRELNQRDTGVRDRLFYLECKYFTLIGGGRPALILSVGAPLAIIAFLTLLLWQQNMWATLTVVLSCVFLHGGLAAFWIWKEAERPD